MKLVKNIIASVIVVGAFMGGVASANTLDTYHSSTNVNISVNNGVATLFGSVDSQFERHQAAVEAGKLDGVEEVRNLLTFSN